MTTSNSINIDRSEKQSHALFAQNIVRTVGKKLFADDKALSCLAKSDTFFKELMNLFNKLYSFNISPKNFETAVELTNTSQTDKKRLELCAKVYEKYISVMKKNGFTIPFPKIQRLRQPEFSPKCPAVAGKSLVNALKDTTNRKYLEFSDIKNESAYIINKIKENVERGSASYRDFAIFADKTQARQKFLDLMKTEQIPVSGSIYNEDYENIKHKINVYQKISSLRLKLESDLPKSQKEILSDELELTTKSLLEELPQNSHSELTAKSVETELKRDFISDSQARADFEPNKSIAIEYGSINAFYESYKQNNYAKAIETVIYKFAENCEDKKIKDFITGKLGNIKKLQLLYDDILNEKPSFVAFNEILEWKPFEKETNKNSVRLSSITTDLKENENFKFIFIAGLSENNFPGNNNSYPFVSLQTNELLSAELKKFSSDFDFFLKTDEVHFEQKYQALMNTIKHTVEEITITTHVYEAKKSTQPSVFFKALKDTDPDNFEKISDSFHTELVSESQKIFTKEISQQVQNDLNVSKVISETDLLKLSPSSISAFQQCPRKYYYKNLINLKEDSTFAASYGNVVHAVFEILNSKFLNSYNKQTALALADVLFDTKNNENNKEAQSSQNALTAGFKQTDIDLIKATDELSLNEMKENFKEAIEDFDMMGYFDNPPQKAVCEKSFSFSLPELPNVVFEGRIDAILTDKDGNNTVLDYKTGKNKINQLEYALSENGVNFKSKTGKNPSNVETLQNNYDYQIPIYYLACQYSDELKEYKDKISYLGLMYIRPKSKNDGCEDDIVKAEKIDFYKDKILQNLKETVIDKIQNGKEFNPQKSFGCDNCSYKFLCDEVDDDE